MPTFRICIAAVLVLTLATAGRSAPKEDKNRIVGAFGIVLGADASAYEKLGFVELPNRQLGHNRIFMSNGADTFFPFVTITASPITRRVRSIKGSKFYDNMGDCMKDYRVIGDMVRSKYAGLASVSLKTYSDGDRVGFGLTEASGAIAPEGRQVSLACATQTGGGAGLIIEYHGSRAEIGGAIKEGQREEAASAPEELRKRGIDPNKF